MRRKKGPDKKGVEKDRKGDYNSKKNSDICGWRKLPSKKLISLQWCNSNISQCQLWRFRFHSEKGVLKITPKWETLAHNSHVNFVKNSATEVLYNVWFFIPVSKINLPLFLVHTLKYLFAKCQPTRILRMRYKMFL